MTYRVLIVDDEAPAREKVARYLKRLPESFALAEAGNAAEAMELLSSQAFDLLLLDIQMPQMDAFEMLKELELDNCPPIIFSTAYNQYALQAFEVHAIDYLLKPYDFDRFQEAVEHVLRLVDQQKRPNQLLEKLLEDWQLPRSYPEIIWVNQGGKMVPVDVDKIEYLEADGNYVLLHTADRKFMIRQTLTNLAAELDPGRFTRVHRSFVLNQKAIREMYPKSHGDLFAVMKSGKKVPVSRRYRERLIGGR